MIVPQIIFKQVTMAIHGSRVKRLPVICRLEAEWRGAFSVLLPKLKPYCFSRNDAIYHPLLGGYSQ